VRGHGRYLDNEQWIRRICERGLESADFTARTTKKHTLTMSGDIVEEEHMVDA
jgi:hypothetical protein